MDFPGKQVTTASRARRWCERGGNQHSCQQGRHLQPASWIARTRRIDIEIDAKKEIVCEYDGYARKLCAVILGHTGGQEKAPSLAQTV
jgi:hypothetical protein